jgi:putative DNA primase/helicase
MTRRSPTYNIHVCGQLAVVAATNDGTGQAWGVLLCWSDADGRAHEWAMPLAMLAGDGTEVRARLLDGGLFVGPGRAAREALAAYLMRAKPTARVRVVDRLGWHGAADGARVFVLPDRTLGAGSEAVRLQTERPDALPPIREAGELADWRREIAARCCGNSRLMLAVSAAFAAPLLGLLGEEGGGFHLRSASSTGKTAALAAAGSVWGGGGLCGWCRSWRNTANALEAVAATHCDLLLCLDEMGEAAPEAVAEAAYMLANGSGKGRAARDGSARRVAQWRVLFLSSGEVGLAERLAEARSGPRRVRAGQEVRVVDVPADAGAGLGVFETLRGAEDGAAFADALKAAARRYHGTAGRAFLARLTAEPDALAAAAREAVRAFEAAHVPKGAGGQVRRVARRFALVAAGGEMAAALGIVPWARGEAEEAAARCLADWIGAREGGKGSAEDAAAIAAVRRFLELHGEARFTPISRGSDGEDVAPERATIQRAGFRRREGEGWTFWILPEVWRTEVCAGFDPQAAARALRRAGHLEGGDGKNLTKTERVPGIGKTRVYVVRGSIFDA